MSRAKGFIFGAVAAATYGMNPLFALPLYSGGMKAEAVLLWRYTFAVLILLVMLRIRGQILRIDAKLLLPLVGLGLTMGLSSLLLFESYNYMAAGIASTMLFVYPVMVALIMCLVYHEKLKPVTVVCLIMATVGIGLLYNTNEGATLSLTGTIMVMLSALSYAFYLVWINRTAFKQIPTLVLTFYITLFGLLLFIFKVSVSDSFSYPPTPLLWCSAIALGLLPTAVSLICTTIAIQNIGSTLTAILGALEPLTALFFGIVCFDETLTSHDIVGIVLIIVAVTVVVAGKGITKPLLRMRKLFPRFYHIFRKRC